MTRALLVFCLFLASCGNASRTPAPIYDLKLEGRSSGTAVVKQGDTLGGIAKRYALTPEDMIRMNMLDDGGNLVHPGQRIALPPPPSYKVRGGDSVTSIAGMFDVNPQVLATENSLKPPYSLKVGQVLRLPSAESSFAPVPPMQTQTAQTQYVHPKMIAHKNAQGPKTLTKGSGLFALPVQGRVVSAYGPKAGGLYNDGINIAAPAGAPVHAANAGTVVYAGDGLEGFGNTALIRHEDGFFTVYSHMADLRVAKGAVVKRGARIGHVGATGKVSEPQLHFEIRKGTKSLNPRDYL